jgi:hypothetical protein
MMTDEPERPLDALKRALTEGGTRLQRSRAVLARTEALLGRRVANDNAAGHAGAEEADADKPAEETAMPDPGPA